MESSLNVKKHNPTPTTGNCTQVTLPSLPQHVSRSITRINNPCANRDLANMLWICLSEISSHTHIRSVWGRAENPLKPPPQPETFQKNLPKSSRPNARSCAGHPGRDVDRVKGLQRHCEVEQLQKPHLKEWVKQVPDTPRESSIFTNLVD